MLAIDSRESSENSNSELIKHSVLHWFSHFRWFLSIWRCEEMWRVLWVPDELTSHAVRCCYDYPLRGCGTLSLHERRSGGKHHIPVEKPRSVPSALLPGGGSVSAFHVMEQSLHHPTTQNNAPSLGCVRHLSPWPGWFTGMKRGIWGFSWWTTAMLAFSAALIHCNHILPPPANLLLLPLGALITEDRNRQSFCPEKILPAHLKQIIAHVLPSPSIQHHLHTAHSSFRAMNMEDTERQQRALALTLTTSYLQRRTQ